MLSTKILKPVSCNRLALTNGPKNKASFQRELSAFYTPMTVNASEHVQLEGDVYNQRYQVSRKFLLQSLSLVLQVTGLSISN